MPLREPFVLFPKDDVNEAKRVPMRERRRGLQAVFFCSMKSTSASTDAKAFTPTSSSSTLIPNSCSRPSTSSRASMESRPRPSPKSGAAFSIEAGSSVQLEPPDDELFDPPRLFGSPGSSRRAIYTGRLAG